MGMVGNPEFFYWLSVIVVVIAALAFAWRKYLLWRKREIEPGRELTPTEVGCLYGHRRAAAVALLWLDESVDDRGRRSADTVNGDAYTAHVARRGKSLTAPTVEAVREATGDRLDEMTDYLISRRLLASRHDRRLALAPLLATAVVLSVLTVAVVINGGGVSALIPFALAVGMVAAALVIRARFGRTRAGDTYLARLSEVYQPELVSDPRAWAYAVAIHGPAALGTNTGDHGRWHLSSVDALRTDDYRRQPVASA